MSTQSHLIDRFVIGLDVKSYSSRSTRRQEGIQRELQSFIGTAARSSGLDPDLWQRQPTGDGELLVLPADVDMIRVVARFTLELNELLGTYNRDHVEDAHIRLRLAMHIDALKLSAYGYAGPALIEVSRLLDARPLRQALDSAPEAAVALIVSEQLYRKAVLSDLGGLRPEQFTEVTVDIPAKNFCQTAYVHVPGHDMRTFADFSNSEVNGPDSQPTRESGPQVVNYYGDVNVNAPGAAFGSVIMPGKD